MTSAADNLPCPHARPSWRDCPHCLGVNAAARLPSDGLETVESPIDYSKARPMPRATDARPSDSPFTDPKMEEIQGNRDRSTGTRVLADLVVKAQAEAHRLEHAAGTPFERGYLASVRYQLEHVSRVLSDVAGRE